MVARAPTLPSFLYLAGEHEVAPGALRLPWDDRTRRVRGRRVRARAGRARAGAPRLLGQVLARATRGVDRLAPDPAVGAATASRQDLAGGGRVRATSRTSSARCRHATGADSRRHERRPHRAGLVRRGGARAHARPPREAGLQPHAARGAAGGLLRLARAITAATGAAPRGRRPVLVCDVGGGTTDFTLIARHGRGARRPVLERLAVGDHLLLGGDNMDLALARRVEAPLRPGGRLEPRAVRRAHPGLPRRQGAPARDAAAPEARELDRHRRRPRLAPHRRLAVRRDQRGPRSRRSCSTASSRVSRPRPRPAAARSALQELGLPYAQRPGGHATPRALSCDSTGARPIEDLVERRASRSHRRSAHASLEVLGSLARRAPRGAAWRGAGSRQSRAARPTTASRAGARACASAAARRARTTWAWTPRRCGPASSARCAWCRAASPKAAASRSPSIRSRRSPTGRCASACSRRASGSETARVSSSRCRSTPSSSSRRCTPCSASRAPRRTSRCRSRSTRTCRSSAPSSSTAWPAPPATRPIAGAWPSICERPRAASAGRSRAPRPRRPARIRRR